LEEASQSHTSVLRDDESLEFFATPGTTLKTIPKYQIYTLELLSFLMRGNASEGIKSAFVLRTIDPKYLELRRAIHVPLDEIRDLKPRLSWSPEKMVTPISAFIHENFAKNYYQWRLTKAILDRLEQSVKNTGAEFVIMILPNNLFPPVLRFHMGSGFHHRFETPDGSFTFAVDEPRHRLEDVAHRTGIRLFAPTSEFFRTL